MTEKSYFYDGIALGDAIEAPYSAELFRNVINSVYATEGYIGYGDTFTSLRVTWSAGFTVSIARGSAFVQGVFYKNSAATTLILDDASALNRIDRIILQVNWNTQTVRVAVKKGSEAVAPAVPTLQQEVGNIYEISLAMVYLPAAVGALNASIVYDERLFLNTRGVSAANDPILNRRSSRNIMHNSDFTAGYRSNAENSAPAMWQSGGSITVSKNLPPFAGIAMSGNTIDIAMGSAATLTTELYLNRSSSSVSTLAFSIQVLAGRVDISNDGGVSYDMHVYPTAEPIVFYHRHFHGAADPSVELRLRNPSGTNSVNLGQIMLFWGPNPTDFVPSKEIVLFGYPEILVDEATSSGAPTTDQIILADNFISDGFLSNPPDNTSVLMSVSAHDTGSAADLTVGVFIGPASNIPVIDVEVGSLTNSTRRHAYGVVKAGVLTITGTSTKITVFSSRTTKTPSAAGTLTYTIKTVGVITK